VGVSYLMIWPTIRQAFTDQFGGTQQQCESYDNEQTYTETHYELLSKVARNAGVSRTHSWKGY
jgi:hypothetical protein